MSDQARALPPGSVKDRQISGQAKIGHGKLAQVADAQVLVGGANKKLSAQTVSGDATLANDGTLTLDDTKLETRVKAVLTKLDIEAGSQKNIKASEIKKIYEEIPGVNQFTDQYSNDLRFAGDANTGSTLVKRDSSGDISVGTVTGNLTGTATNADAAPYSGLTGTVPTWNQDTTGNADTATSATDADKLDGQEGSHYLDINNHTGSTSTSGSATTTKKTYEVIEYTTSNYPISFTHTMPYIPDVSVYMSSGSAYTEIDAQVDATAAASGQDGTITIGVSEVGMNLKVIAK